MIKREFHPLSPQVQCYIKNAPILCSYYHRHDGYEIVILLEKDGIRYWVDEECYSLTEGAIIIFNPKEYHRSEFLTPSRKKRIVISVSSAYLESVAADSKALTACFDDHPVGIGNMRQLSRNDLNEYLQLSRKLSYTLWEDTSYAHETLALAYLLQILVKTNRLYLEGADRKEGGTGAERMPDLARDTLTYLDEHLTEQITLEDLAKVFYHNGTYISRCFKESVGITISQYLLWKRISLAEEYLAAGYSLTDACNLSGFHDYSNFSRSFVKQVGLSPKKYQQRYQGTKVYRSDEWPGKGKR